MRLGGAQRSNGTPDATGGRTLADGAYNRHLVGDSSMPFGVFRQSGWGRERGRQVFDGDLETKAVASPL